MQGWESIVNVTVDALADQIIETRRYLHAHPEPSGEEYQTTSYLESQVLALGLRCRRLSTGRGLIVDSPGQSAVRTAFRADIDALRIEDAKRVDYRSLKRGVMHGCGHDAHAAIALGAIRALVRCEGRLPWGISWRTIFQPAEETSQGALEMVEAGATDRIATIIACHVDPELPAGTIGVKVGALTACCTEMVVVIRGRGGHAARPHQTADPLQVAALLITQVYQLCPRSIDCRQPAVVSFGMIEGGTAPNIIPETVTLRGTIRVTDKTTMNRITERILQIVRGLESSCGASLSVEYLSGPDAVMNDEQVVAALRRAAGAILEPHQIRTIELPSMGGEDFSAYLARVPGALFRLGVAKAGSTQIELLHSPRFDIDESSLLVGTKLVAQYVVQAARPQQ